MAAGLSVSSMLWVDPSDAARAAAPAPGNAATRGESAPNSGLTHSAQSSRIDRSGRSQVGVASIYASRYAGRKMADGTPMRPLSNNAASITLPLGTRARVTNLETGRSAVVLIRDRGPYVRGRIIDLSPATARQIGLELRRGLASVSVAPLVIPSDGASILANAGS